MEDGSPGPVVVDGFQSESVAPDSDARCDVDEASVIIAAPPKKARRESIDWARVGPFPRKDSTDGPESLRNAGRRLAKAQGGPGGTPYNSGRHFIIIPCVACPFGCTYKWRFLFTDATTVLVQTYGQCTPLPSDVAMAPDAEVPDSDKKIVPASYHKKRKLQNAKKYMHLLPCVAVKQQEIDGAPEHDRADERQTEAQRRIQFLRSALTRIPQICSVSSATLLEATYLVFTSLRSVLSLARQSCESLSQRLLCGTLLRSFEISNVSFSITRSTRTSTDWCLEQLALVAYI